MNKSLRNNKKNNNLSPIKGVKTKQELVNRIFYVDRVLKTSLAGYYLLHIKEAHSYLKSASVFIDEIAIDLNEISEEILKNGNADNQLIRDALVLTISKVISTAFEALRDYTNDTSQKDEFEKQSWYNYAYHLRNCFSHNYLFDFSQCNHKKKFPASFKGKVIEPSLHGKEVTLDLLSWKDSLDLLDEMKTLANKIN